LTDLARFSAEERREVWAGGELGQIRETGAGAEPRGMCSDARIKTLDDRSHGAALGRDEASADHPAAFGGEAGILGPALL
jgi:hypothetical protein